MTWPTGTIRLDVPQVERPPTIGAQHGDRYRSWNLVGHAAAGGPNQVSSASGSPSWLRSPTQATYPSGDLILDGLDRLRDA
jgi:hypothetical protein